MPRPRLPGLPSFGSRLLGSPDESERRRRIRVQVLLTSSIVIANVLGAVGVTALSVLLLPQQGPTRWEAMVAAGIYLFVSVVVGMWWGTKTGFASLRWVFENRAPSPKEQRRTLRVPLRLLRVQAVFWSAAALFFALLYADVASAGGLKIGLTVFLVGIVTCAIAYLLSEFAMRPIAALALAADPPDRLLVPGVRARALLAWATGSGIPVLGMLIGALFALTDDSISTERLAVTTLVLGGLALFSGLLLSALATRATLDPIRSVRSALARVEDGDLEVSLPVYDGTEVGLLQVGFNQMVDGLRERERIRDLFSRHVGEDVARDALVREAGLGGSVCEVGILFVDVIGSTTLAAERAPTEVVALLNRFFGVVVDVVSEHGGLVNKLIGDAVLAVWGAPSDAPDPAGQALAAGRALAARLPQEVPELDAGIGVAAGEVVAGNVGDARRFEFTVIGDPVNEAARLTELAKAEPTRLLASMRAVETADRAERQHWSAGDTVTLRGRTDPTTVARAAAAPVSVP